MDHESALFQFKGCGVDDFKVKILGVRDYIETSEKEVIYNDLICLIIDNQIDYFEASTDPGSFYVRHPMVPQGCARLQTGLWWYQRGTHLHVHPALVQADEVRIDRIDKQGNKIAEQHGYFGINIHSGGSEFEVGRFSAGCQVIKCVEGAWGLTWLRFFGMCCAAMADHNQYKVPYLLVDKLKARQA